MRPAAILLAAALAAACGSSPETDTTDSALGRCASPAQPARAASAPSDKSLSRDVAPILAKKCSFASCHAGSFRAPALGSAAGLHRALVGQASTELPSMPYVTPGDPDKSYLMHKLDGDLCSLDADCVGQSCLEPMPKGGDRLPDAERDAIRAWIAAGADDN